MTSLFLQKCVRFCTKYMTVGVIIAGLLGVVTPQLFAPLAPKIPWMLGIIMFGMGMSLTVGDFKLVFRYPKLIWLGSAFQFIIMPLAALLLIHIFPLPPEVAIGVVLVGCCPGGTASNVISYIAKADVALSVSMTMVNTILSPFVTPFLVWQIAGAWIDMDLTAMMMSIVKMVLLPLLSGVALNYFFPKPVAKISSIMPMLSALVVILTVACVVSLSHAVILTSGLLILFVVILHNLFGLFLGYTGGRLFHLKEAQVRAMTIEVGMQNSGLASTLAIMYFTAAGGIAGAIFSVWHNISGSLFASYCVSKDEKEEKEIGADNESALRF